MYFRMLNRILFTVCLISLALSPLFGLQSDKAIAADSGPAETPWPMFGHDPQHTGRSPYTGPDIPNEKWSFDTGNDIESPPVIAIDGTIYVGSHTKLYAINDDGTEKWSFTTGGHIFSSQAIAADGTIYVGSEKNLYAVNPDGTEKWSFATGDYIYSYPIIATDGTIYVGSNDKKLYAINPDGSEKWSFDTISSIHCSPAIAADGTIYVSSYYNKLYAVNADGSEKWNFTTGSSISSSPAIAADGTIYIGSYDDLLYAINPDGSQKWSFTTGGNIEYSPAISSDGTIYIGSFDRKLYAIDPDGTQKWNFNTVNSIDSSPAIDANGAIYFRTSDKLYALFPSGIKKWSVNMLSNTGSSAAIAANGTIYIGNYKNLYAISESPLETALSNIQSDVSNLRGLNSLEEGDVEFITRAELRQQYTEASDEDNEGTNVTQELFILLDLLEDGDDLDQIILDVQSEAILGYYDIKEKKLYVVSDTEEMSLTDEFTLAHEYTHLLQDQHFDLGALLNEAEGDSEYSVAVRALFEGDTTLLQGFYYWQGFDDAERAAYDQEEEKSGDGVYDDVPLIIREIISFPYSAGTDFAIALYKKGGWQAINQAYSNPPKSTEQILHPDKYLDRDDPQTVTLPDLESILGDSWTELDNDVFGEACFRYYLETFIDTDEAEEAAEGWGGDRYVFLGDTNDNKLLVINSVWDSISEAGEFFDAYIDFMKAKTGDRWDLIQDDEGVRWWQTDGSSIYLKQDKEDILLVIAPDEAIAGQIISEFGESSKSDTTPQEENNNPQSNENSDDSDSGNSTEINNDNSVNDNEKSNESNEDDDGKQSGGWFSCGHNSKKASSSATSLLYGWGIIGLCWSGGYYLVRRKGRRGL